MRASPWNALPLSAGHSDDSRVSGGGTGRDSCDDVFPEVAGGVFSRNLNRMAWAAADLEVADHKQEQYHVVHCRAARPLPRPRKHDAGACPSQFYHWFSAQIWVLTYLAHNGTTIPGFKVWGMFFLKNGCNGVKVGMIDHTHCNPCRIPSSLNTKL